MADSPIPDPDTVTITISREDAEQMARTYQINADECDAPYLDNIARACRSALEGEKDA